MKPIVFTGPTLSLEDASSILDATYWPPVRQGDVIRAVTMKPVAIAIIDGTFETSPAVWHKEILWALSEGIHVFGSSSMGALRAAELAPFGMEGVGHVFEWYRSGLIEDDDEVAVAHADASYRYQAASEALVNMRATFEAARRADIVTPEGADRLVRIAKALHYRERSYPEVLRRAQADGIATAEIEALAAFLPRGRVNQKRDDAVAMLEMLRDRLPQLAQRKSVDFHFERTDSWEQCVSAVQEASARNEGGVSASKLREEARLRGLGGILRRAVTLRALAEQEARRKGVSVSKELLASTEDTFRRDRGLEDLPTLQRWLGEAGLDPLTFAEILESEAKLRWMEAVSGADEARHVVAELAASGELGAMRTRTAEKEGVLAARGLEEPGLADVDLDPQELLTWFFGTRLQRPFPQELGAYLRENGFESPQALIREALREFLFLRLRGANSSEP